MKHDFTHLPKQYYKAKFVRCGSSLHLEMYQKICGSYHQSFHKEFSYCDLPSSKYLEKAEIELESWLAARIHATAFEESKRFNRDYLEIYADHWEWSQNYRIIIDRK